MSTIKINGVDLEIDMMDADTAEKVEKAIEVVKNGAAEIEANKTLRLSEGIRATCAIVFECFNNIFGEGTDHKVFGNHSNMRVCTEAFAELCAQTTQQPQNMINGLKAKYSPNRAERRHPSA